MIYIHIHMYIYIILYRNQMICLQIVLLVTAHSTRVHVFLNLIKTHPSFKLLLLA